jgi:hypothetical protein
MATKSKVKKGWGKKKGSKKKSKTLKVKIGLTLGIGVISTIKVPQPLRTAFKKGVNNANVVIKVEHAVSYNKNKLERKIKQFNADSDIGLIVTVGGLIAFEAANAFATKPFISLVGVAPSPSANCFGGVTLESYQSNPKRIDYLVKQKGFSAGQIGLFYNPNSAMSGAETAAWSGAKPPIPGGVDTAGDNDPTTFPADFAKIPTAITAVVVSADPFFQESKDQLVAAADNSNKYLCYPLQDYAGASPQPTSGKTTLFGPALADPFTLLGQRAALVLGTGAKLVPLFVSVPDIVKDL